MFHLFWIEKGFAFSYVLQLENREEFPRVNDSPRTSIRFICQESSPKGGRDKV